MGITSFYSYNKAQTFIDTQFKNADANRDGKVSLLEFETYFPGLLAEAKSKVRHDKTELIWLVSLFIESNRMMCLTM